MIVDKCIYHEEIKKPHSYKFKEIVMRWDDSTYEFIWFIQYFDGKFGWRRKL